MFVVFRTTKNAYRDNGIVTTSYCSFFLCAVDLMKAATAVVSSQCDGPSALWDTGHTVNIFVPCSLGFSKTYRINSETRNRVTSVVEAKCRCPLKTLIKFDPFVVCAAIYI